MLISAVVQTHHLPAEALPWIEDARSIFDEVVIFIDEKRATSGTIKRAEKVASRVFINRAETWHKSNFGSMSNQCRGEWLFMLDYDEELGPEWHEARWRPIVESGRFTHFWFPRRWVVPGGRYIDSDPWSPDFQVRLIRNNLHGTVFPQQLHDPIRVPGCCAHFPSLAIHHHVLWLASRETRLEKVKYYEGIRPGEGLGHLYLYEDYRLPMAALPKPPKLHIVNDVVWMDKLLLEEILEISIRVDGVPPTVTSATLFWFDVEVANGTGRILYPCPPFPVRLSYHWLTKSTRSIVVFEGHRSGLFPCLPAHESRLSRMTVLAPYQPGEYILQVSLVQDGACWFEDVQPEIRREFFVSVKDAPMDLKQTRNKPAPSALAAKRDYLNPKRAK